MNAPSRTLVTVATYNEIENLPRLVEEILRHAPDVDILVIDDNSPDGTGRWCDAEARSESRIKCLHRPSKQGLGTATVAGFHYALAESYDFVITMDADFSHHPRHIPELRARMSDAGGRAVDVAIGSRYVQGGSIQGWPWYRKAMSRIINGYARWVLGLKVADCSGAFRCYRSAALQRVRVGRISSKGYAYLEEILWLLSAADTRFAEIPITFADRELGQTKINWREAVAAVFAILRMGLQRHR